METGTSITLGVDSLGCSFGVYRSSDNLFWGGALNQFGEPQQSNAPSNEFKWRQGVNWCPDFESAEMQALKLLAESNDFIKKEYGEVKS